MSQPGALIGPLNFHQFEKFDSVNVMFTLVTNFIQLCTRYLRKNLIVPLLAAVFVSTELTISPFQFFSKLVNVVFLLYIILKYRGHFTSFCFSNHILFLKKHRKLLTLVAFFVLFAMFRPIFFSVSSFRIGTLYWPFQALMFFATLNLLSHALNCDQSLVKTKSSIHTITTSKLVLFPLTAYLACYEFLYLFGDLDAPLYISFTSTTSQLLPYFLLFPYLWINLRNEKFPIFTYIPIFLSFLLSVQSGSRSNLLLVIVSTTAGILCILFHRQKSWMEKIRTLSPLFVASTVTIYFCFVQIKSLIIDLMLTGSVRQLDTGYTEVVDQDRYLHLVTSWRVSVQDLPTFLFGYGFRESGFVLAGPLREVYEIRLPHLDFLQELGSMTNVSTFGLGSIIVEFGVVGVLLLLLLVLHQIINLPWRSDFGWSTLRFMSILSLLSMLYVFNYTETIYFLVFLFVVEQKNVDTPAKSM
jgi:hypothetical protein